MCNDSALPPSLQDSRQSDEERLILESNPLEWSVTDVVRFIKLTDCAPLARIFQEQVQWLSVSSVYFLVSRVLSLCVCMSVHKCMYLCVCGYGCSCVCSYMHTCVHIGMHMCLRPRGHHRISFLK